MLDFNHILSTPGYDFQQFYATSGTTLIQWQTWRKPRGVNWVYIIGVGGGGSGSTGGRGANPTAAGGGGGGSGGQTTVLIPATMIPDTLYIQCGVGGAQSLTVVNGTGLAGNNGVPTYVAIEPDTTLTANMTLLLANGGTGGGAHAIGGSSGGAGGTLATIAGMPLAGRGTYNFFVGQTGGTGGTTGAGPTAITVPTTGLMVTGGQGGGGGGTTPSAGAGFAAVTGSLGQEFYSPLAAGAVASGATPATAGVSGYIVKNYILNYGGTGGGGSSATAGGIAAAGGNGAPGCGGGGAGAINSVNNTAGIPAGAGGAGFVYIVSW